MPRPADLDELLGQLTTEEKASLTCGRGMWHIPGVGRLGIPGITVTDGPNGARGMALLGAGRVTAACFPCGSSLGASWDPDLVEEVGAALGEEARTKGSRVLLAPTINLHRTPIAGRNFECYAEDPLLSGKTAAAFVRGVQSRGVAATVKHLVGNESEFQRTTMSSDIDERALRELYLVPFEIGILEGGALAAMTAYNRVNGRWCAEDRWLLAEVLRGEWGFEGIVMTDWMAAGRTVPAAEAGLDLQMPGPPRFYGPPLAAAVDKGEVDAELLDAIARRWLHLVDRLDAWDDPPRATEEAVDRPEHRALARRAAADGTVLLRNDGVLPLDASSLRSVALVGPNAGWGHIMGGGSANLKPHYRVSPLQALRDRLGADRVVHEQGCVIDKTVRTLAPAGGVEVEWFDTDDWSGEPRERSVEPDFRLLTWSDDAKSFRATGRFVAGTSGAHTFTLVQAGRSRLIVGGRTVIDGITDPPPAGKELFGLGSEEVTATVDLDEGAAVEVEVEYTATGAAGLFGVKVGHQPPLRADELDRAVAAAADADVAVVVVGTSDEWESEGHDRESMHLPGEQDELVRRVCAANPRTVVVVNAGAPVAMDWADDAAAVLQVWLGGQEMANALAEILVGDAEPAGRLPCTLPLRLEHGPSFGGYPGENHRVAYGEGLLVGYRWYDTRHLPVRFPFGHGGSYTTFSWGEPRFRRDRVEVDVTNTGDRRGAEVVQCYVEPPPGPLFRPRRELKGFAKLWLEPGETATARIDLDDRAFACWDPGSTETAEILEALGDGIHSVPAAAGDAPRAEPGWRVDPGTYRFVLARSVADDDVVATVDVEIA